MVGNQKNAVKFLLSYAFLRYPMKEFGETLTSGIVIVTEDKNVAKLLSINLTRTPMVKRCTDNSDTMFIANNNIALRILGKKDSETEILKFLDEEKFLPVVIATGIVPAYVEDDIYVLRMDSNVSEDVFKEYAEFQSWILQNINVLSYKLSVLNKSIQIMQMVKNFSPLYQAIAMIAYVWEMYYRHELSDEDSVDCKTQEFLEWGKAMIENGGRLTGLCPISEAVCTAVYEFLNSGNRCRFIDISLKEKGFIEVDCELVVFFDDEWYYFPENLLKKICCALSETVTFHQIKQELAKEGTLEVSSWSKNNFTIQKTVHVDGKSERRHFLKLKKEVFISDDAEYIEDVIRRLEENMEVIDHEAGNYT